MNVIASHVYFDEVSKFHIQKELGTMYTLCGVNLGFSYMVVDEDEECVFSDYLQSNRMCKKCINKYNKL